MNKLRGVLALTLAVAGVMLGAQPTFAASTLPDPDANGVITLTEDVELSDGGFVVDRDQNITLDLGEYTLSSTPELKDDLITVNYGGTLTILGNGTIDSSYLADNYAALYNNGTVFIGTEDNYFNGTFKLDVTVQGFDEAGTIVYYLILNHGDLTIYGGIYLSNDYQLAKANGSSMIENGYGDFALTEGAIQNNHYAGYIEGINHEYPTLTIYAGTFGDTTTGSGLNTIKNDEHGIVYIHGGTFTNTWRSALLNYGEVHICDGEFIVTTGLAVIINRKTDNSAGTIEISGGTFEGESLFSIGYWSIKDEEYQYIPENASIKVSGGIYEYSEGLWDEEGGLPAEEAVAKVEVTGSVYAPQSMLTIAKAGATVYVTDYQEHDILTPAKGVTVLLAEYSTKADDTDMYTYSLHDRRDGSYDVIKTLISEEGGESETDPDTGETSGADGGNSDDTGDAEGGTTDAATDDTDGTTDATSNSTATTSSKTSPQTSDVNLIGLLAVTALAAITFVSSAANYRRESQA